MSHRTWSRLLIASLLVAVVALAPIAAAQTTTSTTTATANPEAYVTVGAVTIEPADPSPGTSVTITATFQNAQSSTSNARVTEVSLRGPSTFVTADDIGNLGPGVAVDIPFATSFESAGRKKLTLSMRGYESDGDFFLVQKPVYVQVGTAGQRLQLSVSSAEFVAGEETMLNVTVANGEPTAISGLKLQLNSSDATVANPHRVSGSLAAGEDRSFSYDVTVPTSGEQQLRATLTYSKDGDTYTATQEFELSVVPPVIDSELTTTARSVNGSSVIQASLTDYGNVELRDVQFRAVSDNRTVVRTLVPDVPTEETRTVILDGSDIPAGEVTIVAQYTAAGERRTLRRTMQYSPQEATNIALTGVDVTRDGTTLTLRGDAANMGSVDVSSVLVSGVDTEGVRPISPSKEYFVGAIEASEFATFELTVNTTADIERIPVRITYAADGERFSQVVSVDVSQAAVGVQPRARDERSAGGLPIPLLVGLLVVLVAGVALYRWRFQ